MINEKYEVHPEIAKTMAPQAEEQQEQELTHEEAPQVVRDEVSQPEKELLPQQRDFKELREAKKRIERERDELARKLQETLQPKQTQEEDLDIRINPEDLVEGKHLSKYDKKIRKLEEQLKHYQQQNVSISAETRLKSMYPDFDKVVSAENISQLNETYPELAYTLRSSTDLYNTGVSAYTLIKKLGIHQDDNYVQERERVQKNMAKPRSVASIAPQQSESPLTQVNAFSNGLTDDLKKQLHKEMIDAMKAPR
jgi:hypothetical protein